MKTLTSKGLAFSSKSSSGFLVLMLDVGLVLGPRCKAIAEPLVLFSAFFGFVGDNWALATSETLYV